MADFIKVNGKNIGNVKLYALSTCGWCKKTKKFLNENGIEYSYVDVDKIDDSNDLKAIKEDIKTHNPRGSFPTIVVDNNDCIIGYDEDKLYNLIKR